MKKSKRFKECNHKYDDNTDAIIWNDDKTYAYCEICNEIFEK